MSHAVPLTQIGIHFLLVWFMSSNKKCSHSVTNIGLGLCHPFTNLYPWVLIPILIPLNGFYTMFAFYYIAFPGYIRSPPFRETEPDSERNSSEATQTM